MPDQVGASCAYLGRGAFSKPGDSFAAIASKAGM